MHSLEQNFITLNWMMAILLQTKLNGSVEVTLDDAKADVYGKKVNIEKTANGYTISLVQFDD